MRCVGLLDADLVGIAEEDRVHGYRHPRKIRTAGGEAGGSPRRQILQEQIVGRVEVARYQLRRRAGEQDLGAVRRNGLEVGVARSDGGGAGRG